MATHRSLEQLGVAIPNFDNLGSSLQKELDGGKTKRYSFQPIEEPMIYEPSMMTLPNTNNLPDLIDYESDNESRLSDASQDKSLDETHPMVTKFKTLQIRLADDQFTDDDDSMISESSDSESAHNNHQDESPRQDTLDRHFTRPKNHDLLVTAQGCIRAYMAKSKLQQIKDHHSYQSYHLRNPQGKIDANSIRQKLGEKRMQYFSSPEDWVISLQAMIRTHLAQNNQRLNQRLHQHSQTQSHEHALQKLKSDKNPPIGVVKSVLHMLSNNDVDFDEDLVIEDLRQKVIESIRENSQLDSQVSMVDVQIALLLKNAVTLDEVVKLSNAFFNPNRKMQQQQRFSELVSNSQSHDLTSVDKTSREKLELYQQLIYLLQTEPAYLARLMSVAGGHSEKRGQRRIDATVLALFGYGTNAREECLLINLCKACIVQEMKHVQGIQEFMRGNYTFMKLVVQVNR